MAGSRLEALVYEHMLLSRYATQGTPPHGGGAPLDRSATILLSRLQAEGPMTVAELAEAFGLDVSTVHRQVATAMQHGLIERIRDPDGGVARKHRATAVGRRRLSAEFAARRDSVEQLTADWPAEDLDTYVRLLRRFNEEVEAAQGTPWPRRD